MRTGSLFASLLLLTGCALTDPDSSDSDDSAIVGGSTDTSAVRNVGFFSTARDQGQFCTGTLIAPRVVVSAAHCFDDAENRKPYFSFGKTNTSAGRIRVTKVVSHPRYGDESVPGADIAYAVLERAVTSVAPAQIQRPSTGCRFLSVGYGVTRPSNEDPDSPDDKKKLEQCAKSIDDGLITVAGRGGSICFGDSGGPLLVRDQNVIVGVASTTSVNDRGVACSRGSDSHYTQLIGGVVDAFVRQALAAGGPGAPSPAPDPDPGPLAANPAPAPPPGGEKGGCYSYTLGQVVSAGECVRSSKDRRWYRCEGGKWIGTREHDTRCSSLWSVE